jgi:hypothetical protein
MAAPGNLTPSWYLQALVRQMPELRLLQASYQCSFDAIAVLPYSPSVKVLRVQFCRVHLADILVAMASLITASASISIIDISGTGIYSISLQELETAVLNFRAAANRNAVFQKLRITNSTLHFTDDHPRDLDTVRIPCCCPHLAPLP